MKADVIEEIAPTPIPPGSSRVVSPNGARLSMTTSATSKSRRPLGCREVIRVVWSIDVTATFRRKGESATWGGDFRQVSTRREPLAAGQSASLVLKSDTRYYSNGPTEGMLTHAEFKDTTVQLFVRVGSSKWTKFTELIDVDRRIGARSVQDALPSPAPSPGPSPSPSAPGRR